MIKTFRTILLLLPLILCSCATNESISFISKYNRSAPINHLERQIDTSTHTRYGHTILVYDLLNLNHKNDRYISRGGTQISSVYLYLTSEDMDREQFYHLIDVLIQKVIHKTQNQYYTTQTLNTNATRKLKELAVYIAALDQRLKKHKVKRHHQLVITVSKMATYLKQHSKKLEALSLNEKLNLLDRINHALEKLPLTSPLSQYKVTDRYRMRAGSLLKKKKMHSGVDLVAPKSSDVFASAAGVVTYAGRMNGYGSIVIINHGNGVSTCYAHLRKIAVKKGQYVLLGETVGIQGNTGNSSGEHLHYEIRLNNKPINPDIIRRF